MSRATMTLTEENAGIVRAWCESHGAIRAVIRGGPAGGSHGASVLVVTESGQFELLPGDTAQHIPGVGVVPT